VACARFVAYHRARMVPTKQRTLRPTAGPARIAAGAPADVAIPRLLAEHGGRIHALAVRLCRRPEDAEDLVQEIFLQAYRKWAQFDGRANPTTWLFTIAVRACQRMHRRRAGQPRRIESLDELLPFHEARLATAPAGPSDAAGERARREALERVEAAIARLPAEFRLPLVLKDIVELPLADVAAALGIKPATVKTRLHRARLRLRKTLLDVLPQHAAPPPAYARQVCLDLLWAKQDALDRGVRFPVGRDLLCERCRAIFATLDWMHDLCGQIAEGELPPRLRQRLLASLARPPEPER
jgi:RNA polymerase sigma-70 factor, ECF subfamily